MRRALLAQWPAMSHYFGIRPWEADLLTPIEAEVYRLALADIEREAKGR